MKRLFWVGVGVAVTVVALRQVSKLNNRVGTVVHAVSPAGLGESISGLAASLRESAATLKESMAEHEAALTAALLPSEAERRSAVARLEARDARRDAPDDLDYDL